MPTISVSNNFLKENLKFPLDSDFEYILFDFGLELDAIEEEETENGDKTTNYKIEIPANRCDLLSPEFLCLMLNIFKGYTKLPKYSVAVPENPIHITVDKSVKELRPFIVCALLRDVDLTKMDAYDHLIDLQTKLHQNIGRNRSLLSMGTHDLDTLTPPFLYTSLPPSQIKFVPLSQTTEMDGFQMMEACQTTHLRPYLPLIQDFPRYPVIYDSTGVVLSVPPIINGEHSKITRKTKNIFIEMTATDYQRALIAMATLITSMSFYSSNPNPCGEQITVKYDDKTDLTPFLPYRVVDVSCDKLNSLINLAEPPESIRSYLSLMGLESEGEEGTNNLKVVIPPTRQDIIHWYDIAEDYAIAYGFNNIPRRFPGTMTVASQAPLNSLGEALRLEMAMMGYIEVSNFTLCSIEEIEQRLDWNLKDSVRVANPKTSDFQIIRPFLFPGLLKSLRSNRQNPLPISIFELGDVVLKDANTDVGAKNHRRVCALHCKRTSAFEHIHGSLDRLFNSVGKKHVSYPGGSYELRSPHSFGKFFLPGRGADIVYEGKIIGFVGELSPLVIKEFDVIWPCSIFELDISQFLL